MAVDVLRRSFGDRFLVEAWEYDQSRPLIELWEDVKRHPVFGQGFWPGANGAPWTFANLLELAAQLELCRTCTRYVRTCKSMRDYREPPAWTHGQLQFELAGLGLRAKLQVSFEPPLGTGRFADVRLDVPSRSLVVETTAMSLAQRDLKALHTEREVSGRLMWVIYDLQVRHGVQVSGQVGHLTRQADAEQWLREVESAMVAVAGDGVPRNVAGPTDGLLRVTRGEQNPSALTIEGSVLSFDPLGRIRYKIEEKALQVAGSAQDVWVRMEESALLWPSLTRSGLDLPDKLAFLTPIIQQLLEPHAALAGVILAPVELWEVGVAQTSVNLTIRAPGGSSMAVRSGLPGNRMRETLIIMRKNGPSNDLEMLAQWYADEVGWLDWALTQLGRPPFKELITAKCRKLRQTASERARQAHRSPQFACSTGHTQTGSPLKRHPAPRRSTPLSRSRFPAAAGRWSWVIGPSLSARRRRRRAITRQ